MRFGTEHGSTRLSTGVDGLDAMLGGGYVECDAVLVAGSPGTGKTTLGLHYLAAGVRAGQKGVLVTFEYLPQQLYRDARAKGWPLKEWEEEGKVRVVCTTPDVLMSEIEPGRTILDEAIRDVGADRLVIDSVTHFEFLGWEPHVLRERMAGLMNHLRLLGVTAVITHEIPQIVGPAVTVSNYGLEFLVDNVIVLRYVELEGEMQKAINVLKFRGGAHDRKYRALVPTDRGIRIEAGFQGVENISGGAARRSVAQRARELI